MHLDSHDVARFRTVVGGGTDGWVDHDGLGRDRHLVGVALQMTMPGVPVVFAGDEIGLTGVDGEHARTPFPWRRRDEWDDQTLEAYRTWIAVRREHVALRRGGLRWLGADGDSMTYLREHPEQTVLVHLTRAPTSPTRVPLGALGPDVRGVTSIVGEWPVVEGDHLVLPGAGPAALAVVVS
jgi:alpha-glucosidase